MSVICTEETPITRPNRYFKSVATGHYAQVSHPAEQELTEGDAIQQPNLSQLLVSKDEFKDQV